MRIFAEVIVAGVLLFAVFATFAVQVDRAGGYINEAVAIGETRMIILCLGQLRSLRSNARMPDVAE